eukprot:Hpha_TRINITY_DN11807_c0_g1::TRINITY_DN11807_c0_g1_i1::g.1788::m.1788
MEGKRLAPKAASMAQWTEDRVDRLRARCLLYAQMNRRRLVAELRAGRGGDIGEGRVVADAAGDEFRDEEGFDLSTLIAMGKAQDIEREMFETALEGTEEDCLDREMARCDEEELLAHPDEDQPPDEDDVVHYLVDLHGHGR